MPSRPNDPRSLPTVCQPLNKSEPMPRSVRAIGNSVGGWEGKMLDRNISTSSASTSPPSKASSRLTAFYVLVRPERLHKVPAVTSSSTPTLLITSSPSTNRTSDPATPALSHATRLSPKRRVPFSFLISPRTNDSQPPGRDSTRWHCSTFSHTSSAVRSPSPSPSTCCPSPCPRRASWPARWPRTCPWWPSPSTECWPR